jgi:hypothetical protein
MSKGSKDPKDVKSCFPVLEVLAVLWVFEASSINSLPSIMSKLWLALLAVVALGYWGFSRPHASAAGDPVDWSRDPVQGPTERPPFEIETRKSPTDRTEATDLDLHYIQTHSANMHMIPADDDVRRALLKAGSGDPVRVRGLLRARAPGQREAGRRLLLEQLAHPRG